MLLTKNYKRPFECGKVIIWNTVSFFHLFSIQWHLSDFYVFFMLCMIAFCQSVLLKRDDDDDDDDLVYSKNGIFDDVIITSALYSVIAI